MTFNIKNLKDYSSLLNVLKYVGLVLATVSSIWSATNIESNDSHGQKYLTKAGSIAIVLTVTGLAISIFSNILEDKLKDNKEKAAAIAEIQKTNRIILAGQPLTELLLEWEFKVIDQKVKKYVNDAEQQMYSDYNDAFFNVPMRLDDSKLLNCYYLLYPFINFVCEDNPDSQLEKNVLALISLDNTQNAILPIGLMEAAIKGFDNEMDILKKNDLLYSGGIRFKEDLDSFWLNSSEYPPLKATRSINDAPFLKIADEAVCVNWQLDPFTFYNCLDRQSPNVAITANLPQTVKISILSKIDMLPFVANNLALPHECYPWRVENIPSNFKSSVFSSSTLCLTPNGLTDEKVVYKLKTVFKNPIIDFWGDENTCNSAMFIYEKQVPED